MNRRILSILGVCIMSLSLVACSNTEDTQASKEPVEKNQEVSENEKEESLSEDVIIVDEDGVKVKILEKENNPQGNNIGYNYSVSNSSDSKIGFYIKDVTVDGVEHKTDLEEGTKMTLETNTDFSTSLTFWDITSIDELKNTKGVFCIEVDGEVKEYNFELE